MRKLLLISVVAAVSAVVLLPAGANAASSDADQRVLVELAVPANASAAQISAASDALLASLPADSYTVTNRYSTIPFLGLAIPSATRQLLEDNSLVVTVYNDEAVVALPGTPAKSSAGTAGAKSKCKKSKTKAGMKKYKKCKKAATKKGATK